LKLRDANVKSHQIDQERIDELIQTLARVRKDRDNLAEECKTLRSGYENGYRDHLQDFKSSFTDVTRIYDREMASVRAALSSRDEELKQAREASTRCQQELSDSKALYHESRRELEVAKASLQRNQKEFGNLKALHEQLNGNYDRLHKELDGVKSEKQTLESRNKELAEQVKEATLDANGKAATEDFKSKLSQNFQKAATAMQSEAQILRMEKEQYQRELEGRDDTIAKLMQELETLRSQRPAEASYPSPGSEPRDPYGAWDGPGGGLLAVQMPEPSVSPCSPSFPMAPSSPPSRIPPRLPPRPQSTASNHPPFPSTDIHVDISFGGAQGGGYPPPNQQAMRRPVPRPPTRNGMGFNNSHLGPQVKRARTPQLQPSGWYDENDRNAPPAWAPRLMPPSVGGWN
jgi:archaellum component FlaC